MCVQVKAICHCESCRKWTGSCMMPVVNDHAAVMQLIDVPGGVLNVPVAPTMHLNYAEKILAFKDGLPKFKDLPAAFNGSDEKPED